MTGDPQAAGAIEYVRIPDGVTGIRDAAFANMARLDGVRLPNTLSADGEGAFSGCSLIESMVIPQRVTGIGAHAFDGCNGDTGILLRVLKDSCAYQFAAANGIRTRSFAFYPASAALPEATVPREADVLTWTYVHPTEADFLRITFSADSVLADGDILFFGDQRDEAIDAFYPQARYTGSQVSGLVVALPTGEDNRSFQMQLSSDTETSASTIRVTYISAISLEEYMMPIYQVDHGVITAVSAYAYNSYNEEGPEPLIVPAVCDGQTITGIGAHAFSSLEYGGYWIQLPDTVTTIGDHAFDGCMNLETIGLPAHLRTIGDYAFYYTWLGGSLVLPNGLESIGSYAFAYNTPLESIAVPASVTYIGEHAFDRADDDTTSIPLKVVPYSYAQQYAVENGLAFELISASAGQMVLMDGAGEPIENARIDRTYYGDCGYYFLEGTPVASIANYDDLKQGRETEPVFAYELISGPDDLSIWFDGGTTPYVYFDFDLAEEDAPADVVYRCSFAWDDMEPAVFDLYFHLKNLPMGPYQGVAINPPSVDMLPGQSFTATASWLPEGWGIAGETTWMECQIENWPDEEEYPLKNVSQDGTALTATIDRPGYYTVSMRLHTSLNNYVNYAHITVRNPDGSLPVLIPNIYEVPYEMMAAEGTAENPYYFDCPGNYVGYLSADNGWYFAEYGQEDPRLVVAKTEADAPDLTAVPNADKPSAFDIYLGDPENPVIPAGAAGDWHYTLTLWWGSESSSVSVSLHVEGMPAVFTLPAGLTAIEAEAFRGVQADVFVIPENVTSIDPSAFDPGVRLMVAQGSYAESFAIANGFAYDYSD